MANRAADEEESARTDPADPADAQDDLGTQLDATRDPHAGVPTADDVSALDERLKRVEDDTAGIPDDLDGLDSAAEATSRSRMDRGSSGQIEANGAERLRTTRPPQDDTQP